MLWTWMRAVLGKMEGLLEGFEVERTRVDARVRSMLESRDTVSDVALSVGG